MASNLDTEELIFEIAKIFRKVTVTKGLGILFYRRFALQIIALFRKEENMWKKGTANLDASGIKAYYEGVRYGIWLYAWWKDGIEYVGTCGKPYKETRDEIDIQEQKQLAALEEKNGSNS